MKHELNSLFPHVVTREYAELITQYINGLSADIEQRVSLLCPPVRLADSYRSQIEGEKAYKHRVSETIKIIIRNHELDNRLAFTGSCSDKDELLRWLQFLEEGSVTPKLEISWHRFSHGLISWTLVSVAWVYSDTESVSSSAATSSDPLDNLAYPLNTPQAVRMFQAFINAGLVRTSINGHLQWTACRTASKCPVAFAYFVTQASDFLRLTSTDKEGNLRYSRKPFEDLFLIHATSKKSDSNLSAKTRQKIDGIFARLSRL
jgi:hypothetical protein